MNYLIHINMQTETPEHAVEVWHCRAETGGSGDGYWRQRKRATDQTTSAERTGVRNTATSNERRNKTARLHEGTHTMCSHRGMKVTSCNL